MIEFDRTLLQDPCRPTPEAKGRASYLEMAPGQEPLFWEGGAYFQGWYPVHVAAELEQGKVIGRKFIGSKIILYRDPSGQPVAQTAYCPHLGADLSDGDFMEGEIRCPYHHWRFGADGGCTHIASGTRPPRAGTPLQLPCR